MTNDAYYNAASDRAYWDAFIAAQGQNTDASSHLSAPIISLAPELIHAAFEDNSSFNGSGKERIATEIENIILAEPDEATGSNITPKDNHNATGRYFTQRPYTIAARSVGSGCNQEEAL